MRRHGIMDRRLMWWGYLHSNGIIQVKRWFGDHKDYTEDCDGNPFVLQVVQPFEAASRDEALKILKQQIYQEQV